MSRAEAGRCLPGRSLAMAVCYCCHALKRESFTKLLPSNGYSRYNTYFSKDICKYSSVLCGWSSCYGSPNAISETDCRETRNGINKNRRVQL
jgi:hypothetical protein